MRYLLTFLIFFGINSFAGIKTLHMPPSVGMTRADVNYLTYDYTPIGILVLCLGYNSNAKVLLEDCTWGKFSQKNRLILVGLSFASRLSDLKNGNGYYYASRGSGQVLLQALASIADEQLPIYIYGFSGGAHFTSRFVEWIPERIAAWCAYSAGWWDIVKVSNKTLPYGIVACGNRDIRYNASLSYFKDGRKQGRPWTWIKLSNTGHVLSKKLDEFVRAYFEVVIHDAIEPCMVDILKCELVHHPKKEADIYSFLPNPYLFQKWKALCNEK